MLSQTIAICIVASENMRIARELFGMTLCVASHNEHPSACDPPCKLSQNNVGNIVRVDGNTPIYRCNLLNFSPHIMEAKELDELPEVSLNTMFMMQDVLVNVNLIINRRSVVVECSRNHN